MNVSKNHVVCARCHFAGLASAEDCTIMSSGVSGAQSARLRLRTRQNSSASTVDVSTLMGARPQSISFPSRGEPWKGPGGCPLAYHSQSRGETGMRQLLPQVHFSARFDTERCNQFFTSFSCRPQPPDLPSPLPERVFPAWKASISGIIRAAASRPGSLLSEGYEL